MGVRRRGQGGRRRQCDGEPKRTGGEQRHVDRSKSGLTDRWVHSDEFPNLRGECPRRCEFDHQRSAGGSRSNRIRNPHLGPDAVVRLFVQCCQWR